MPGKRTQLSLAPVRTLSLAEVIEYWTAEADISRQTLEHELRLAVVNLQGPWREGELIDPETPNEQLPGLDTLVDRKWLRTFCEKQLGWPLPAFWFPPDPVEVRRPGRPTNRRAIVQEFEARKERGETAPTISEEARAIRDALTQRRIDPVPIPKMDHGQGSRRLETVPAERRWTRLHTAC